MRCIETFYAESVLQTIVSNKAANLGIFFNGVLDVRLLENSA